MIVYLGFLLLLLLLMIGAAIYSIIQRDLLYAVIGTGVISLVLSALFYMLQAPDVALTEAAIGVALTTIIFIITIRNTVRYEGDDTRNKIKSITK